MECLVIVIQTVHGTPTTASCVGSYDPLCFNNVLLKLQICALLPCDPTALDYQQIEDIPAELISGSFVLVGETG